MTLRTGTFSPEQALDAACALHAVLASRTHRRKVMGQEVVIPGQLGEALNLPRIINQLQGRQLRQREAGAEAFDALWLTLSVGTRQKVLESLEWYDPRQLQWDDKRSNRRSLPDLNGD